MDSRKISVCITTWNRYESVVKAIEHILDDDRVSEIVISDDCSTDGSLEKFITHYRGFHKVKVYKSNENIDCYRNKRKAILLANNNWCILFDSDNILTKKYIDKLYEIEEWHPQVAFLPDYAKPNFDYRTFSGKLVDKLNVKDLLQITNFECCLNTMNYFVNQNEYLKVWDDTIDPVTSDSIYQNYRWLQGNNKLFIVEGLEYEHTVHDGSHYKNNEHRTPKDFHQDILNKLSTLC